MPDRIRGFNFLPNPLRANTPGQYGQVLPKSEDSKGINMDTWTCDIRLWSGEILRNVRMPGGYIDSALKAHGKFGGISENQLVYVDFSFGSSQSPIIIESYPYFATEKDFDNLKLFLKSKKLKKDDIVLFHNSGYSIWMTKFKISLYLDVNPLPIAYIDLQTNMFSVNLNVKLGQLPVVSVPNGELLLSDLQARQNFENQTKNAIETIKNALLLSPTTPLDGGASYKTGISVALASLVSPTPVTPPANLLNTNLKVSST